MPEISRFFGIIIRMFYDDHPSPHIHVEFQGIKAKIDFRGNVPEDEFHDLKLKGRIQNAIRLH